VTPASPLRHAVIADASPLIGLARTGRLGLLSRLLGPVQVTQVVVDEILGAGVFPETPRPRDAFESGDLVVARVPQPGDVDAPAWVDTCANLMHLHQIDAGDASSLALAGRLAAQAWQTLPLIDDRRGREAAATPQIATIGAVGVLLLTRRAGRLESTEPALRELRNTGYFLSDRLVAAALAQAGETGK
jgi:predicted nucleic acid-binding protein